MIDWVLTKEKFNIITIDGYRPKVICKCDKCGKEKVITIRVKAKVVSGQMPWECVKCVSNKPVNVKKMKDIRNKKIKPNLFNKIYYSKNKEHLLEKSRMRRRKTSKICSGCKKSLQVKQFYCNATYIAKYCLPCEEQHNLTKKEFQFKLNNIVLFEQQKTLKNTLYVDSTNIPQTWKYPIWSDSELNNDFERIIKYKPIGKFKQTVSTPYGYKIVKHFHKSFWHSAPKNSHPIVNAFVDTKVISDLLNKLNDNRRLSYRRLLREIFFNTNYKYPSIFATHLAIEILAKYSKPGDVVYDPCAGWGNRWLASLNDNLYISYHCSEPNEHIRKENVLIASYFKQKINIDGKAIGDGTPSIKSDIVFTSPPWGDTEYYHAGGEVKSTILDSLLLESSESLKDGGVLILHLPHPPANWPDPDETIKAHARSRYRGNSISSVFIWKANTIKSFKVF